VCIKTTLGRSYNDLQLYDRDMHNGKIGNIWIIFFVRLVIIVVSSCLSDDWGV